MHCSTAAFSNSGSVTVNPGAQLNLAETFSQASTGKLTLPGGSMGSGVGSNLLSNAGFESPQAGSSTTTSPGTWITWGNSYVSTQYAHTGAQSLKTSGQNSGVLQAFPATPGVSYSAAVYGMTPTSSPLTGPEGGFLQMMFYDSAGNQIIYFNDDNANAVMALHMMASTMSGGY